MEVKVTHNQPAHRFEIRVENHLAVLEYQPDGESIDLFHTEVPTQLRGRGLGDKLVKAALDYAKTNHLKAIPSCPFVAAYMQKHPEDQR